MGDSTLQRVVHARSFVLTDLVAPPARASAQAGLSPTSLGSAQDVSNVTNERRRRRTRRTRTMPWSRCQAISIHFCVYIHIERSVTAYSFTQRNTMRNTSSSTSGFRSGSAPGCSTRTRDTDSRGHATPHTGRGGSHTAPHAAHITYSYGGFYRKAVD